MTIDFQNIPSEISTPLFYLEFDASKASTYQASYQSLLVGLRSKEDAKAPSGEPILISNSIEAGNLFGFGSMLERMVYIYKNNHPFSTLYCLPLSAPTAAEKASIDVILSGQSVSSANFVLNIAGENVQVLIPKEQPHQDTAQNLVDGINENIFLPVTAERNTQAATTTVKIKAKFGGELSKDIHIIMNPDGEAAKQSIPAGLTIAFSGDATITSSFLKEGTGTVNLSSALANLGSEEYDFIISPFNDTANITNYATLMNDESGRWSYLNQIYGHVYTASRGTAIELINKTRTINNQHLSMLGINPKTASSLWEVLAAFGAQQAKSIIVDPARPTQTLELIGARAPKTSQDFTKPDRQTLLTNGVATTYSLFGKLYIERAITTYLKNSIGVKDNSYRDSETLHTLAYIARFIRNRISTKFKNSKLGNDGARQVGSSVVTPSIFKSELLSIYSDLEAQGIVENADEFAKHLVVERASEDPNRLNFLISPDLINQLRVIAGATQFRLQF